MELKPLVVISRENAASQNIRSALASMEKLVEKDKDYFEGAHFNMAVYDGSIIEIVPSHDASYYIYASTHKSAANTKSLTVHTPGNWGSADMGGKEKTLNVAYGSKMKIALRKLKELKGLSAELKDWAVTLEVDHHGPTIGKPLFFIEIGSTESEWGIPIAGKIVAQAILEAIKSHETFQACVGFGGTHYAPKFTPLALESDKAFGHIIPSYALEKGEISEEMVRQAIERNVEKMECALIDWKGIKGAKRAELIAVLDKMGVRWEKA